MTFDEGRTLLNQLKSFDRNNPRLNKMLSALDEAKLNDSLNKIIDAVNNNSMTKDKALSEIYLIYKTHRDNERICSILIDLCNLCIMEHINKPTISSSSVSTILNSLINNRSTTFKRNAVKLRKAHDVLCDQLGFMVEILRTGKNLTAQGKALKQALDYFKLLSD